MAKATTKTKTTAAPKPAAMKGAGVPKDQQVAIVKPAPPPPPPLTAVQRAERDRNRRKAEMLDAARYAQVDIERVLKPRKISFDFFLAALEEGLRNTLKNSPDFFEKVSVNSFMEAVLKFAFAGVLPDGKQGAIVSHGPVATAFIMIGGMVEIAYKDPRTKSVNYGTIYDGDEIDFREGDDGFVHHKRNLRRKRDAEVIGAWCVIEFVSGGKIIEICDQADLADIARMSKAGGPRSMWRPEFEKKAPFRRAMKRFPKSPEIEAMLSVDNESYLDAPRPIEIEDRRAAQAQAMSHDEMLEDEPATLDPDEDAEAEAAAAAAAATATIQKWVDKAVKDLAKVKQPKFDDLLAALKVDPEAKKLNKDQASAMQTAVKAATARLNPVADGGQSAGNPVETGDQGRGNAAAEEHESEGGASEAPVQSEDRVPDSQPPALRSWLSSVSKSATIYDDPKEWLGDMLNRVSSLKGDALVSFWKRNAAYVVEADSIAPEQSKRVTDAAAKKGLHHAK